MSMVTAPRSISTQPTTRFKTFFIADFQDLVFSLINGAEKEFGIELDEGYKTFLCSFYTEALAGVLIEWIKNRTEMNQQQVMEYLIHTIKDSLIGIFRQEHRRLATL